MLVMIQGVACVSYFFVLDWVSIFFRNNVVINVVRRLLIHYFYPSFELLSGFHLLQGVRIHFLRQDGNC